MAALDPAIAIGAMAHRDSETGRDGPRFGQVHLPLEIVAVVHHRPATIGAMTRQRRMQLPVGRAQRDHAMPVAAVALTRLSSRRLRCWFRVALGKRCRLAFTRPP